MATINNTVDVAELYALLEIQNILPADDTGQQFINELSALIAVGDHASHMAERKAYLKGYIHARLQQFRTQTEEDKLASAISSAIVGLMAAGFFREDTHAIHHQR